MSKLPDGLDENPANWVFGEHTADHVPSGVKVWTANGFAFLGFWHPRISLGFVDKWRLRSMLNRIERAQLEAKLTKVGEAMRLSILELIAQPKEGESEDRMETEIQK